MPLRMPSPSIIQCGAQLTGKRGLLASTRFSEVFLKTPFTDPLPQNNIDAAQDDYDIRHGIAQAQSSKIVRLIMPTR